MTNYNVNIYKKNKNEIIKIVEIYFKKYKHSVQFILDDISLNYIEDYHDEENFKKVLHNCKLILNLSNRIELDDRIYEINILY